MSDDIDFTYMLDLHRSKGAITMSDNIDFTYTLDYICEGAEKLCQDATYIADMWPELGGAELVAPAKALLTACQQLQAEQIG